MDIGFNLKIALHTLAANDKKPSVPPTAEIFPRNPKPLSEDFISLVKGKALPEQKKIGSVDFRVDLYSTILEPDLLGRLHRYLGVDKLPASLSEHLDIPKELGNYEIIREIGRGAFSLVCLARDKTSWLERKLALKIPIRQSLNEKWMQRVLHEAKMWKVISDESHPNILRFEDLKRVGSFTFFVMEYIDGGNLASVFDNIDDSQKYPVFLHILKQVCEGLAFAHLRGVIHGDIKPQNILVSGDLKQVKLADFGLSFLTQTDSQGNTEKPDIAGTLMFMAPECFDGEKTTQTDIYALGVTLFYLLTGENPFDDSSTDPGNLEQLRAKRLSFQPNLRAMHSDVPLWLEEVILRCMSPNPKDRFSDAGELLDYIIPFIDPSRGRRTVFTAWYNHDSQTIDYDIEIKGQRIREMLSIEVTNDTIKGLCTQWDQLGLLALKHAGSVAYKLQGVKSEIQDLLAVLSEDGAHFILGTRVRKTLEAQKSTSLWFFYDPRLAAIPWELMGISGSYLCRRFPVSRWPKLLKRHSEFQEFSDLDNIRILIVADPSGELEYAKKECKQLQKEFLNSPMANRLIVDVVDESVDSFTLRSKMRRCHILHYAGHGIFSDRNGDMSESGWRIKGNILKPETMDIIRASAFVDFWAEAAPVLVFSNACSSARGSTKALQKRFFNDATMGLAQAFLSAGIENYVGTLWDPPDSEATIEFASIFYREFFAGRTVGEAMLVARNHCAERFGEEDLTWARYVLFGDPLTHIPGKFLGNL